MHEPYDPTLPIPPDHEATVVDLVRAAPRASSAWGPGWPNCQEERQERVTAGGVSVNVRAEIAPLVRRALTDTLATGYVLKPAQTGAYVCRPIGGTSTPSNHSWGLAVDLNWQENPFTYDPNAARTITPAVVAVWKRYGFSWGGDWAGKKDFMHMEFNGSPADAARRVAALTDAAGMLCDFSYSKPRPEQVPHAGIVTYLSTDPRKVTSRALLEQFLAAGKTVNLVKQEGATDALGGFDAGRKQAEDANRQADEMGAPAWLPIVYIAQDSDLSSVDFPTVAEFFRGVWAVRGRPVGRYGGGRLFTFLDGRFGAESFALSWLSGSTSFGPYPAAHLQQHNGAPFFPIPGVPTDDNTILRPFPRWGLADPVEDDDLTPEQSRMLAEIHAAAKRIEHRQAHLVQDADGAAYGSPVYLVTGGGNERRWVPSWDWMGALMREFALDAPAQWSRWGIDQVPLVGPEAPGVPVA